MHLRGSRARSHSSDCYSTVLLFQVPTASITVEGNPALNRVRWAHSGKEIAVGDSDGRVLVYEVGEVSRRDFAFHHCISDCSVLSLKCCCRRDSVSYLL